jgi:hypothetical protein
MNEYCDGHVHSTCAIPNPTSTNLCQCVNTLQDTHPRHASPPPFFSTFKVWCYVNLANFISNEKNLEKFPIAFGGHLLNIIIIIKISKINLNEKIGFCFVLDHDLKPSKSWYYRKALNKMVWYVLWLFHNFWINRVLIRLIIFMKNSLEFTQKIKIKSIKYWPFFLHHIGPYYLPFTTHGEMHEEFPIVRSIILPRRTKITKVVSLQWNFFWKLERDMKRFF